MSESIRMNYEEIVEILPHRPPFLLVDRVVDLRVGESIEAIKCVSILDPYFAGHFPGQPIFPGVYIVEGLAQASAILCFKTMMSKGQHVEKKCVLTGVEEARFRKPVLPGDVLHYFATIDRSRGNFVWVTGQAKVDDDVVAEMKLTAMIGNPLDKKGAAR